jgi:hypothetical protein
MALTINLPSTIEQQFRQEAALKGLSLDSYLLHLLKKAANFSQPTPNKLTEYDLLKKINLDISESEWATYKYLVGLRRAENLTEQEHETLVLLGEKIEKANAKRLEFLLVLAQMRGIPLDKLMLDLGIKPLEI